MHCTCYSLPQCSKKHYWGSFLLCFVVLIVVYMRVCACESCISHGGLLTVGCRDRLPRLSSECFFECLPLPFSLFSFSISPISFKVSVSLSTLFSLHFFCLVWLCVAKYDPETFFFPSLEHALQVVKQRNLEV